MLFDFGGVIAEEGFYSGLIRLAEEQDFDTQKFLEEGMQAVYDSGFVLGQGTAEDFWSLLCKRTGLEGDDDVLSNLIMAGFQIRPAMIELVRDLHAKGYVTGILSDQTYWLDELDAVDHFYQEFDYVYNSYYLGKGKRDSSIFSDVADKLNLRPAELLFVDDNEQNIQRARQKDLSVIHYVTFEGFVSELEMLLAEEFAH